MIRRTFNPVSFSSILIGVTVLLALLAILTPQLLSGDGNGGRGNPADRGEDPVVGSLPCLIFPGLDGMWEGDPEEFFGPPNGAPTVVLTGISLASAVSYAEGEPYGYVNRGQGWTALGLQNAGRVYLSRRDCAIGNVGLWQWLPDNYVGGTLSIASPWVNRTSVIHDTVMALPFQACAAQPTLMGSAVVTLSPGPGHENLPIRTLTVAFTPSSVVIQYQP